MPPRRDCPCPEHSDTIGRISNIEGRLNTALPKTEKDTENIYRLIEEHEETAQHYYGQVRELTKEQEEIKEELEKKATKDDIANVMHWVYGGFVVIALSCLVFLLYVVLNRLGVKVS